MRDISRIYHTPNIGSSFTPRSGAFKVELRGSHPRDKLKSLELALSLLRMIVQVSDWIVTGVQPMVSLVSFVHCPNSHPPVHHKA